MQRAGEMVYNVPVPKRPARNLMARRVLIVSPHFPPINAPDHQRVRMSLPYFEEFGWRPTVLAVRPEDTEGTDDPLLERTLPDLIEIIRTGALPVRWTRRLGLGNLALRALPAFWRAGNRLLARERFDAVYFSTTMFAVMALGPLWRRRFGVPYILDFQDPWIQNYYNQPGAGPPPGGRFKTRVQPVSRPAAGASRHEHGQRGDRRLARLRGHVARPLSETGAGTIHRAAFRCAGAGFPIP